MKRLNRAVLVLVAMVLANGCAGKVPSLSPTLMSPSVDAYTAGHGILVVDTTELDHLTYALLLDDELSTDSKQAELVLPKGDYSIMVYLKDATTYSATVTVNGGLEITTVKPVSKLQPFEKVADGTEADYIVSFGDGRYLVYDAYHKPGVYTAEGKAPDIKVPLKRVYQACYLSDHQVLLLGDKTKAVLFDTATGISAPFTPDGVSWDKLPLDSGRCVSGAVQFAVAGQIFRVGLSSVEIVDLPEPDLIATGEFSGLVADADDGVIVTVQGDDYIFPGGLVGLPGELPDPLLGNKLVITSESGRREADLGELTGVLDVSLSPDSSKAAVVSAYFVRVYDTVTAELLYAMPSDSKAVYWRDNNTFIYRGGGVISDLYLADIANRESYGLTNNATVDIALVTGVVEDYLYFITYLRDVISDGGIGYRIALK